MGLLELVIEQDAGIDPAQVRCKHKSLSLSLTPFAQTVTHGGNTEALIDLVIVRGN